MDSNNVFWNIQTNLLLIFGMILQILMGEKQGAKLIITVVIATLFVGWFITPALIEISHVDPDSKIAQMMLAMSALISVEIIAVIITIAPKAVAERVRAFLGVKNVS